MKERFADTCFSIAYWIWDLPGLADERWVYTDDDVYPDTWIGRLADLVAHNIYRLGSLVDLPMTDNEFDPIDYSDLVDRYHPEILKILNECDDIEIIHDKNVVRLRGYYGERPND